LDVARVLLPEMLTAAMRGCGRGLREHTAWQVWRKREGRGPPWPPHPAGQHLLPLLGASTDDTCARQGRGWRANGREKGGAEREGTMAATPRGQRRWPRFLRGVEKGWVGRWEGEKKMVGPTLWKGK
jgi:hypothetical protein